MFLKKLLSIIQTNKVAGTAAKAVIYYIMIICIAVALINAPDQEIGFIYANF